MKEPTPEELEANVTGVDELEDGEFGGNPMKSRDKWVYFDKAGSDVKIPVEYSGFVIPLSLSKYGFPNARKIKTKKTTSDGLFAGKREVALNEALETITGCVNESMEYDMERVYQAVDSGGLPQEFKSAVMTSGYRPKGDETFKGICGDAGRRIRNVLAGKLADQTALRCIHVSSQSKGVSHDTTLIFDTAGGGWAVLNSKSPLKPYNLVPKERLHELGRPYG